MKQKTALVTGAASGIGKSVAASFKEQGVRVFSLDNNWSDELAQDEYNCDIGSENDIIQTLSKINSKTSHIDYLINVAGIFCRAGRYRIDELPLDEWEQILRVNLTGTFLMIKHSVPMLKRSGNGNIVNFSSEQTSLVQEKSAPYAITKAAIEMLTRISATELLDIRIKVNTIALAAVKTDFIKEYIGNDDVLEEMMADTDSKMPFGIILPDDVSDLVNYLVSESCKMTGQTILVDSGVILAKNK